MAVKITSKERKAARGPNAQTRRSLKSTNVIQYSDGSAYKGADAGFMDMRMHGQGFIKMRRGIPYVKIKNAA